MFAYRYDLFSKLSSHYIRLLYVAPVFGFSGWAVLMIACQNLLGQQLCLV